MPSKIAKINDQAENEESSMNSAPKHMRIVMKLGDNIQRTVFMDKNNNKVLQDVPKGNKRKHVGDSVEKKKTKKKRISDIEELKLSQERQYEEQKEILLKNVQKIEEIQKITALLAVSIANSPPCRQFGKTVIEKLGEITNDSNVISNESNVLKKIDNIFENTKTYSKERESQSPITLPTKKSIPSITDSIEISDSEDEDHKIKHPVIPKIKIEQRSVKIEIIQSSIDIDHPRFRPPISAKRLREINKLKIEKTSPIKNQKVISAPQELKLCSEITITSSSEEEMLTSIDCKPATLDSKVNEPAHFFTVQIPTELLSFEPSSNNQNAAEKDKKSNSIAQTILPYCEPSTSGYQTLKSKTSVTQKETQIDNHDETSPNLQFWKHLPSKQNIQQEPTNQSPIKTYNTPVLPYCEPSTSGIQYLKLKPAQSDPKKVQNDTSSSLPECEPSTSNQVVAGLDKEFTPISSPSIDHVFTKPALPYCEPSTSGIQHFKSNSVTSVTEKDLEEVENISPNLSFWIDTKNTAPISEPSHQPPLLPYCEPCTSGTEQLKSKTETVDTPTIIKEEPDFDNLDSIITNRINALIINPNVGKLDRSYFEKSLQCFRKMRDHGLAAQYKCMGVYCAYYTSNESNFSAHLKHHQMRPYMIKDFFLNCAYCFGKFNNVEDLVNHINSYHKFCRYQCSKCFFRSSEPQIVFDHCRQYHMRGNLKIIECANMPKKTTDEAELKKIIQKCVKRKIWNCNVCSSTFQFYKTFMTHLHTHMTETSNSNQKIEAEKQLQDMKGFEENNKAGVYYCIFCPQYCNRLFASSSKTEMRFHLQTHPSQSLYTADSSKNFELVKLKERADVQGKVFQAEQEDLTRSFAVYKIQYD